MTENTLMQALWECLRLLARFVTNLNSVIRYSVFCVCVFIRILLSFAARISVGVRSDFARLFVIPDAKEDCFSPQTNLIYTYSASFLRFFFYRFDEASKIPHLINFNPFANNVIDAVDTFLSHPSK
ncbi:MAG: hypothetical protein ACK4NS_13095, partial [Saprospiraceae bacterium]